MKRWNAHGMQTNFGSSTFCISLEKGVKNYVGKWTTGSGSVDFLIAFLSRAFLLHCLIKSAELRHTIKIGRHRIFTLICSLLITFLFSLLTFTSLGALWNKERKKRQRCYAKQKGRRQITLNQLQPYADRCAFSGDYRYLEGYISTACMDKKLARPSILTHSRFLSRKKHTLYFGSTSLQDLSGTSNFGGIS